MGSAVVRDDIRNIRSDRKALREFGVTIGAILLVLAGIAVWRGKPLWPYFLTAGAFFAASGLLLPQILKIPNKLWMTFSIVVGFFMSRAVLTILFYGVITPIGLVARMLGKDMLDQKIDRSAPSYWTPRAPGQNTKKSYEKQF